MRGNNKLPSKKRLTTRAKNCYLHNKGDGTKRCGQANIVCCHHMTPNKGATKKMVPPTTAFGAIWISNRSTNLNKVIPVLNWISGANVKLYAFPPHVANSDPRMSSPQQISNTHGQRKRISSEGRWIRNTSNRPRRIIKLRTASPRKRLENAQIYCKRTWQVVRLTLRLRNNFLLYFIVY